MSRSRRKAIIKDVGHRKEDYWRVHRRVNKVICKDFFSNRNEDYDFYGDMDPLTSNCYVDFCTEPEFKQPKELVNDYDYKDWVLDYEYGWGYSFYMSQDNYTGNNDWKEKFRRK